MHETTARQRGGNPLPNDPACQYLYLSVRFQPALSHILCFLSSRMHWGIQLAALFKGGLTDVLGRELSDFGTIAYVS